MNIAFVGARLCDGKRGIIGKEGPISSSIYPRARPHFCPICRRTNLAPIMQHKLVNNFSTTYRPQNTVFFTGTIEVWRKVKVPELGHHKNYMDQYEFVIPDNCMPVLLIVLRRNRDFCSCIKFRFCLTPTLRLFSLPNFLVIFVAFPSTAHRVFVSGNIYLLNSLIFRF